MIPGKMTQKNYVNIKEKNWENETQEYMKD